jgi:hypothetical protein
VKANGPEGPFEYASVDAVRDQRLPLAGFAGLVFAAGFFGVVFFIASSRVA